MTMTATRYIEDEDYDFGKQARSNRSTVTCDLCSRALSFAEMRDNYLDGDIYCDADYDKELSRFPMAA